MAFEVRDGTGKLEATYTKDISSAILDARALYFAKNPKAGEVFTLTDTATGEVVWTIETS